MTRLTRRLRAALVLGLASAAVWVVIGVVLTSLVGAIRPTDIDPGEGLGRILPVLGVLGFLAGLGFAGLVALAERGGTAARLPVARTALWGFLGGVAVPLMMGADGTMGWLVGAVGAVLGAATALMARRASAGPGSARSPAA